MATRRNSEPDNRRRTPPATSPEAREKQLISLAYDAAEDSIRSGKATSQLLTHFLKLGTEREKLEREKLAHESSLLEARVESMASAKRVEELYGAAIAAMRAYAGQDEVEEDYED